MSGKTKNKFKIWGVILFILFCLNIIYLRENNKKYSLTILNKAEFQIEKAKTDQERYQGLSFREKLCQNCGMLFLMPEKDEYLFSMRNMNFNLDFVWISNGEIVRIDHDVPFDFSGSVSSQVPVEEVLEISSGEAKKNNLQVGDRIFWE